MFGGSQPGTALHWSLPRGITSTATAFAGGLGGVSSPVGFPRLAGPFLGVLPEFWLPAERALDEVDSDSITTFTTSNRFVVSARGP